MNQTIYFVGMWYDGEVKPFYLTLDFVLARRMFMLLLDMGYDRVATNAHFY